MRRIVEYGLFRVYDDGRVDRKMNDGSWKELAQYNAHTEKAAIAVAATSKQN